MTLTVVLALVLGSGTALPAAEPKPTEYVVKAAFLYNFARFVDWPDDGPPSARQDTLRIGILGEDPFGSAFETVLGRSAGSRPVRVLGLATVDQLEGCHILFVSASERRRLPQILEQVKSGPILSVSDIGGFAERGGIVGFVTRNNKIRFQINTGAAERAGVRLSAKLLRLAELVGDGD